MTPAQLIEHQQRVVDKAMQRSDEDPKSMANREMMNYEIGKLQDMVEMRKVCRENERFVKCLQE